MASREEGRKKEGSFPRGSDSMDKGEKRKTKNERKERKEKGRKERKEKKKKRGRAVREKRGKEIFSRRSNGPSFKCRLCTGG